MVTAQARECNSWSDFNFKEISMNWKHIQNGNHLYIKDMDTNRFVNIYVDESCFDGKYGIVDDTGFVEIVNEPYQVRGIVFRFFSENKPNDLDVLMNKCGYRKIGYS